MKAQATVSATVQIGDLERFSVSALTAVGVPESDALTTARALVTTDSWGIFTHGSKALPRTVRRVRAGGLRADAVPTVITDGPAWSVIDAGAAIGQVGSAFAMQRAIAKARVTGLAYVGVRNTAHFGAAGYWAAMAAEQGMIGVAMSNDHPSMTIPGAKGRVLGNNPLAFAIPSGRHPPVLLDMALSTVAGGKLWAAMKLGKTVPADWSVDSDGKPTTDPSALFAGGALTSMAGHKGYGLAVLVETLSAVLTGAAVTSQVLEWFVDRPDLPTKGGAAFIAIDVGAIMPMREFAARMEKLVDEIHAAPRSAGSERIYVPGEMEWERRAQAQTAGIALPEDVLDELRQLSRDLNVELPASIA
jgi:ureidoglycolate dehydrogenase (NAD+)